MLYSHLKKNQGLLSSFQNSLIYIMLLSVEENRLKLHNFKKDIKWLKQNLFK